MTIEEQLKQEILTKYKSIRAFTTTIQIPYSTLDSVFKRGIANAGIDTMLKVFSALNLDIESIQTGKLDRKVNKANASSLSDEAMQIARKYDKLDDYGQRLTKIVINEELNRVHKEGDKPFILAAARTGERFVADPITEDDLPPETTKIP